MRQFGIGQPIRRVEDRRFLTGSGRYLDDIVRPRQAHAAMLRSPHAHARIGAIETAAAHVGSGRRCRFHRRGSGARRHRHDPVREPGHQSRRLGNGDAAATGPGARPGAACRRRGRASSSPRHAAQARDAAELVEVDYEMLPSVVETATALDAGQPAVWDEQSGNLCFDWEIGDRPPSSAQRGRRGIACR